MKLKMLIAALMVSGSSLALAQTSATIVYGIQDNIPSNTQAHNQNLIVKTDVVKNVFVDAGIYTTVADVSRSIVNRYEIGASTGYDVVSFANANIRVAVGDKSVSGAQNFAYYSVEPGVTVKTPVNGLSARVAYRFRTAFDATTNADTSNTMRYAVGYELTKKDKVTVGYDQVRGDGANNTTTFAYTRTF